MANIVDFIISFGSKGGNAVVRQAAQLQGRLDAADSSARRLSDTVGNNLRNAFMSLPGASFFMNPIVAISAGIGAVSKLGMQAQTTATSFEVLVGSQEKSSAMLDEINEYAKVSPYDRLGAQDAAKTMLGFGVAAEDVIGDLKMLGDVAGGDNNRLRQLALVFGQISSAGKLQGQDLLQLINAGYNPLLDIAALTGKSMAEVRDEMTKGNVSIDMVRAAFVRATSEGGRYYGMIDKISETASGKFGEMKDTFVEVGLALYNVIEPMVIPALETATSLLEHLISVINFLAKPVQWVIDLFKNGNPVVLGITAAVAAYTAATLVSSRVLQGYTLKEMLHFKLLLMQEKAQRLLNAVMKANPVGLAVAGIAALIAVIATCWNKFAGFRAVILTVWDALKGFGKAIMDLVVSRVVSLVQSVGKLGQALGRLFTGDFSGAWESAKEAGKLLLNIEGRRNAWNDVRSTVSGLDGRYDYRLEQERKKQEAKNAISDPEAAAGTAELPADGSMSFTDGGGDASSAASKAGEAIATGGTRSTVITLTVGSLIGQFTVNSRGVAESRKDIERIAVEALTRSLEIATSAAR